MLFSKIIKHFWNEMLAGLLHAWPWPFWWPRWGFRIYWVVIGVTSEVGVPSTRLVFSIIYMFSIYFPGIDVNNPEVDMPVITQCALLGWVEEVDMLLRYRANINQKSKEGMTVLHYLALQPGTAHLGLLFKLGEWWNFCVWKLLVRSFGYK